MSRLPVEDELELRNLVAYYAHHADAGESDAFAALYTENGSWTRENSPPAEMGGSGLPAQTMLGSEELKTMIEESIIRRFKRKFRHQMTDVLIEAGEGPGEAQGRCRALITDWSQGAGRIAMMGQYTFRFCRTAEGWRFASVSVRVLPE